jgi:hypothetical protein
MSVIRGVPELDKTIQKRYAATHRQAKAATGLSEAVSNGVKGFQVPSPNPPAEEVQINGSNEASFVLVGLTGSGIRCLSVVTADSWALLPVVWAVFADDWASLAE